MSAMANLVAALRDPASVAALDGDGWSGLLSVARAEMLLGTLAERVAERVADQPLPPAIAALLAAERAAATQAQRHALWEAEMAQRALASLGVAVVLLKGTAYAAAGLSAAAGRHIGDLDILVARPALPAVETAVLTEGWEWVKDDPYDQAYYRDHMHELPPLIHAVRDRMIDVHHTILPLTARVTPDAGALMAERIPLASGLRVLSPADMICHAAAHLIADGDMAGGLRNLWDIDRLVRQFAAADGAFWATLAERTSLHGLERSVQRALRLTRAVYGTPLPTALDRWDRHDRWFVRRVMARDDWGRETQRLVRLIFTIRGHWMRMPPLMLARHLWVKWRRG